MDLSGTMIFMTSNLGGGEITELMTGRMGFAPAVSADTKPRLDEKVERIASEAAKRKFAPEFMNRIDKVVVFHPLRREQLEQILRDRVGTGAAAGAGDGVGTLSVPRDSGGAGVLTARRNGPQVRSPTSEASDRAVRGVSTGAVGGDQSSELWETCF